MKKELISKLTHDPEFDDYFDFNRLETVVEEALEAAKEAGYE
jgi:hypothetical protein